MSDIYDDKIEKWELAKKKLEERGITPDDKAIKVQMKEDDKEEKQASRERKKTESEQRKKLKDEEKALKEKQKQQDQEKRENEDEKLEEDITSANFDKLDLDPDKYSVFWYSVVVNKRGDTETKINHRKYIYFVRSLGYRRHDMGNDSIFIHIKDRIIEEVTINRIQDHVIRYVKSMDKEWMKTHGYSKSEILDKLYIAPAIYFNSTKLSLLGEEKDLVFNTDTRESCYLYYSNTAIRCTSNGCDLVPYKKMEGYIFKKQIKDRKFFKKPEEGMFCKFIRNVSERKNDDGTINEEESNERFKALCTNIGYLLHSFFEYNLKCINFTDSTISDTAEGRTGKTLTGHAIGHIKNQCEFSGKDFDPTNKHKYSEASLDSQNAFINDLKKKFDFEYLFNDISDGFTVDKKNQHPFKLWMKLLIASNQTFRTEGASAKDRVCEFEFSEHYFYKDQNDKWTPEDDFGVRFFTGWDELEWLRFDNFMAGCVVSFFMNGLIEAKPINLIERKQREHINPDVYDFINEKVKGEKPTIKNDEDIDKKELHEEFLTEFPEYKTDRYLSNPTNFNRLLKRYAQYSTVLGNYHNERKSNGKRLIRFSKSKIELKDIHEENKNNDEKQIKLF